jgi:hypothetical protein
MLNLIILDISDRIQIFYEDTDYLPESNIFINI